MKQLITGLSLAFMATLAQADVYGLVLSRTADVVSEPQLTAEGGISLEGDLTTIGGQVNYKTAPNMLIYGGLANVDPDYGSGEISFGGGVVYQLSESLLSGMDMAVKGSVHTWSADSSSIGVNISLDSTDVGVELVVSPQEQNIIQGAKVFGMVGLHRLSYKWSGGGFSSSDSSMEIALAGGAVLPAGPGEAFLTFELIDELFIGGGFRMALGQ